MSKLAKWVLAAAFAVAVAGSAHAQRQPGGQGGRGGGFGQQSIFVTALTNADLQKELKITDEQKKTLKPAMDKAEENAKKMREMFTGGGGPPDREAMQKMMEDGRKFAEETKAMVEKALTPEQVKRAKQIEVQVMGMRAFSNEDVAKALKVTDDQKEKLKSVMEDYGKQSQDLRQEYGIRGFGGGGGGGGAPPDPEKMAEYQKKNKALTDETMEKVMKGMTDEQKKAWKDMVGEPFDTSKLIQRPMRRDN
jgi:Spy/CpxP family protein refolding chaperone